MQRNEKFYQITVDGKPFDRGYQHGHELKNAIVEHTELWRSICEEETKMSSNAYIDKFLKDTNFLPAIMKYAPDVLEEVRGIACGSGISFEETYIRQLSDEEAWYRDMIRYGIDYTRLHMNEQCTSLGQVATSFEPTRIAQNLDWRSYFHGFQTIIHLKNDVSDIEACLVTVAGKLTLCGMNNYGVAVCCNTLAQLDYNLNGLPQDFIIRTILDKKTADEAIEFVKTITHASGQNYLIGDPGKIVMAECGGNKVVVIEKHLDMGRFIHTNHPLVNDDTEIYNKTITTMKTHFPEEYKSLLNRQTTNKRYDRAVEMAKNEMVFSEQMIVAILSDHSAPICNHGGEQKSFTVSSVIYRLDRQRPVFTASFGAICKNICEVYHFPYSR